VGRLTVTDPHCSSCCSPALAGLGCATPQSHKAQWGSGGGIIPSRLLGTDEGDPGSCPPLASPAPAQSGRRKREPRADTSSSSSSPSATAAAVAAGHRACCCRRCGTRCILSPEKRRETGPAVSAPGPRRREERSQRLPWMPRPPRPSPGCPRAPARPGRARGSDRRHTGRRRPRHPLSPLGQPGRPHLQHTPKLSGCREGAVRQSRDDPAVLTQQGLSRSREGGGEFTVTWLSPTPTKAKP
jgi:hypothetical protein